jgi:prepilin-type N-terminal cleavage/methylation domain-containing protein
MKRRKRNPRKGFTFIEILVVIGIMGILLLASYPSIQSSLETRSLENAAKEIQTAMQRAKFEAVKTKLAHRVRFSDTLGYWQFMIESQDPLDLTQWHLLDGYIARAVPSKFIVTISLPNLANPADPGVLFTVLGTVPSMAVPQNSIELQSLKLKGYSQDDLRRLEVYMGGSIRYVRARST